MPQAFDDEGLSFGRQDRDASSAMTGSMEGHSLPTREPIAASSVPRQRIARRIMPRQRASRQSIRTLRAMATTNAFILLAGCPCSTVSRNLEVPSFGVFREVVRMGADAQPALLGLMQLKQGHPVSENSDFVRTKMLIAGRNSV